MKSLHANYTKKLLYLAFLLITPLLVATHNFADFENYEEDGDVFVKVLIKEKVAGALVEVKGGYRVSNPLSGKNLSSGFFGKRYYLQTNSSGLKWGEGYPGIHQIKITPKKENTSILVDGFQYKGSLEIYDINGKVFIVNELKVDDYLKSMLSCQFPGKTLLPKTWEALAIAARTHIYHAITQRGNPYWDLLATEDNYQGFGVAFINPNVDRAVETTRSLVLLQDKKPFATSWTGHCAGKTACYRSIFRKRWDSPEGVLVAFAQKHRDESRWKCSLSKPELASILKIKQVTSVDVYRDSASKKVYAIRIHDGNTIHEMTFLDFQKTIGSHRVLSNDFNLAISKEALEFEGFGEGHGVGICLYSANEMAGIGDSVPEILSYFYPKARLMKLGQIPKSLLKEKTFEEELNF